MNGILEASKSIANQITEDRRNLHRNPEIGFNLPNSAAYVLKRLNEMGISAKPCGGPIPQELRDKFVFAGFPDMAESTGVVATVGHGEPCILLRADMDALPMPETPGLVDFTSENPGLAHMCGHDTHTAMLLGAAQLLKNMEDDLCGTVKFMFQTGEECGCGSKFMIDNGVMENPKVDAAFALHVMSQQDVGTVNYTPGIASAAMDTFMLKIKGKGAHSSQPQTGIDPIMIANQLYTTLNLLSCREIDPRETVALTVGKCSGGTAANVIPDTADMQVAMRTFNIDVRNHLLKRIPEMIDHTITMWRGEYELKDFHTPSTYTDGDFCETLSPFLKEVVGDDNVQVAPCMAGTEDFGYVTEQVPSMFVTLGVGNADSAPMHNPNMVVDESMLPVGSAISANCAIEWLKQNKVK